MRVIIHTTETTNRMTTIEVDLEAVNAYYEYEVGIAIDGNIPDWAIKNFLRDQGELWLEKMDAENSNTRITNWNHTLDEINVIS